jgi:hypothetical protein
MDCNSTSREPQEIRLVCHDPDAGCGHLFHGGAAYTIVRLPEDVRVEVQRPGIKSDCFCRAVRRRPICKSGQRHDIHKPDLDTGYRKTCRDKAPQAFISSGGHGSDHRLQPHFTPSVTG